MIQSAKVVLRKFGWYKTLYRWMRRKPEFAGRWVELRGNRIRLDGCVFQVNAPGASRKFKSHFVQNRYERDERNLLRQYIDPALPVIELGGGIGVTACLVNKRLLYPERHLVIEANPSLIALLERNRELNSCQYTCRNLAYTSDNKEAMFRLRKTYWSSSTRDVSEARGLPQVENDATEIVVPAASLAVLLSDTGFSRCTVICDIEGSEFDLLEHEVACLAEQVALFIVEFHSPPVGRDLG